jgi:hypothetical protein
MNNFKELNLVSFPEAQGINVNMMPIIVGDKNSLPPNLQPYSKMIDGCGLDTASKAYLTVAESIVPSNKFQRRPGIHTDGTISSGWGGGGWGGKSEGGIFIASTDGDCQVWDYTTNDVDQHGALLHTPNSKPITLKQNTLYWLTDRTPHESLPSKKTHYRQFFRLVADFIGVWWAQHSTPNPFGIMPNAHIEYGSKFL